jgi:hypothetical protein
MATKWKKIYTDISNVNGGNEYETGDHITKETVNVALNNTAYLKSEVDKKVDKETNKGLVTQQILANTDLNTVKTNGFYGVSQSCTNKPVNKDDGNLIVLQYDSSNIWTTQVYITLNLSENKNRIYSRGYDNSKKVWSPWKQIDNDPSLYNLGAYDTYVDNGDGTTTITRQTGYKNYSEYFLANYGNWGFRRNGSSSGYEIGKDETNILGEITDTYKSNYFKAVDVWWNENSYASSRNWLSLPKSYTTKESYVEFFSKNVVIFQYKLVSSYTETIITGLPQITLDKQGCEWLRSEWEKGLNLWNKYQGNMNEGANKASIKLNTDNKVIISVTSDKDPYIFAKQLVNLPSGTYTLSYNRSIGGSGTYAKVDGKYLVFSTTAEGVAYLTFSINSTTTIGIRLGGDISGNNADTTYTNFMLVKGSVPYSYQPYNSSYHITNEQADFLKQEYDLSCNLFETQMEIKLTAGSEQWRNRKIKNLVVGKTYTLYGFDNNTYQDYEYQVLPEYKSFKNRAYTFVASAETKEIRVGANTLSQNLDFTTRIMLIEGTVTPTKFSPYNGSIIHEKQLSLQAPSMGHKVANECMMNVTGEYYNNSSSDVYILLGNIKPAYKEARDGGFIISGTIGQYYYTQQAQIIAVAYWRDKVKWKGIYTQDNSDGNFNNIVDLIITTTNKIYLVIKAGQFGQYNLQLQGVTIQYTGNILTAKEGSTATTFSQSEAIDLTALDTSLSDKLKFIDNNAITDPDGDGNYKIDNNYIYDEELATNGVDYTPFDGSSSYDSQSGINQDFYKAIRALRNRHLYHTTITHGYNTTSYGQNTGEFFEVTIFTSDDKTGYNTAGTAWIILRDYLNNNSYTLGNVANWITSNQVYPCNGQLLKYSSSGSVSLTYNIYGVSYNNGKFYVHYYTNTNAYGTSELSYPDSYWRVKSTKIF